MTSCHGIIKQLHNDASIKLTDRNILVAEKEKELNLKLKCNFTALPISNVIEDCRV